MRLAPNALDRINYTEVTLQKLKLAARKLLPAQVLDNLKVSSYYDFNLDGIVLQMDVAVWARHIGNHSHRWPATWWDAVKERFAPQWFLARSPVDYRGVTVDAYHAYPTLAIQEQHPITKFVYHEFTEA